MKKKNEKDLPKKSMKELTKNYDKAKKKGKENPSHKEDFNSILNGLVNPDKK